MELLAKVYVTPKVAILDPQGKAVASSLKSLGYEEVADVRQGKYIVVRLVATDRERARARVREMCEKLLVNLVIEDFEFDLEDVRA